MSRHGRIRRWLARLALALLGLLCVVVLALTVLLGTGPGRSLVLGTALSLLNRSIPGTALVSDLERLDEAGLRLRGLSIEDPAGKEVLRLESLAVDYDLLAALSGNFIVHELRFAKGFVDLRELDDRRRGLLGAFVDPEAVEPEESPPGEPPYVRVERLVVDDVTVFGPKLPTVGELDLHDIELAGSFELDEEPQARLDRAKARIERDGETLGSIDSLQASLERGAEPSSLQLRGTLLGSPLRVDVSLVLPPEPTWDQRELHATFEVEGLTASAVAKLLAEPGQANAYRGRLTYRAEVFGTPERPALRSVLGTAGGDVHLDADLRQGESASVRLTTTDLVPGAVRADLPQRRLDLRLEAQVGLDEEGDALPLSVRLEGASLDDERLPSLDVSGRVGTESVSGLRLRLADAESRLVARGDIAFDGTGEVRGAGDLHADTVARVFELLGVGGEAEGWTSFRFAASRRVDERVAFSGQLDTDGIRIEENVIDAAHLRWDVQGSIEGASQGRVPQLEIEVAGHVAGARIAGQKVQRAQLTLRGGPERYKLELEALAEKTRLRADLNAGHLGDALLVAGSVAGTHEEVPFELSLTEVRVDFQGAVRAREVLLHVAGQRLRVEGAASPEALDLRFYTGPVLLSKVGEALRLDEPLDGRLNLRGTVAGSPDAPAIGLQVTLLGATVGQAPAVDLLLDGHLDAPQGQLAFELVARAAEGAEETQPGARGGAGNGPRKPRLRAELPTTPARSSPSSPPSFRATADGQYGFAGGPGWTSTFAGGEGAVSVELAELDLAFVEGWLPDASLPVVGEARGSIEAQGSLSSPEIEARLDSEFRRKGAQTRLTLSALLRLENDLLSAFGRIGDAGGSLADLAATASLPEASIESSSLERLSALPSDGRWSVQLLTPERDLRGTGFVVESDAIPPLAYSVELEVHHEPRREPEGFLRARVRQLAPYPSDSPCKGGPLRLDLLARLDDGQLWAEAHGSSTAAPLFEARGGLELRLANALRGGAVSSGPFDAHLLANRVPFASVPLLCERVHGQLTARARLRDPTGDAPQLDVELDARDVTLGAPGTIDLRVQAHADVDDAAIEAHLVAPGGRSEIRAQVPLNWKAGALTIEENAPLRGRVSLRELPLAPLIPPDGPISYAVGTIDGQVDLRGTLGAPDLDGVLELHDVGFTATDVAQPLRDVEGRLRFTERTLRIEGFRAHDRDGSLALDGYVTLDGPDRVQARVDLTTRKFPLRQLGQVLATVDAEATIHTDVTPDQTNVRVIVEDVHIWIESTDLRRGIALEAHPDFVIDGDAPSGGSSDATSDAELDTQVAASDGTPSDDPPGDSPPSDSPRPSGAASPAGSPAAAPVESGEGRLTRVDVETRGRFWVNRKDFAVRLSADLQAESRGEVTAVRGEVSIDRGYVVILGRVFDLERDSRLDFVGASPPDPILDMTAVHENRRSGQRITLRIGGRASEPELTFLVDGRRAEPGTALLAIYGSQRTTQDPKSAERQAAGFVGGLTAGLLATTARRRLGAAAPILMIDPGDELGEGRLRAGFELDALVPKFLRDFITGVYFEGIVARESTAAGAPDTAAQTVQQESRLQGGVLLEFYFPAGFFNTNQYGPGATWSVDLGWQL